MYKAVKHLDFYYLVEEEGNRYPEYIELTEEEYNYFLKRNQEYGYQTRMAKGKLISCEINQPSPLHVWDEELGEWVANSEEVKLHTLNQLKGERSTLIQEAAILKDIDPEEYEILIVKIKELTANIKDKEREIEGSN